MTEVALFVMDGGFVLVLQIVFLKGYSEHNFPNSQLLLTIYPPTAFILLSEKPLK